MATVLIVDDDPFVVELVSAKMRQLGYDVASAENGEVALEQAQALRPDLILLDLLLPRISGEEVCRRLRADDELRAILIIMLTGKMQDRDIEAGFTAGAEDYLIKPFSPRELQARVRAAFARASRQRMS